MGNKIHIGDNLNVLKQLPDESVDLIYLDPPFNKGRAFTGDAGVFLDRFDGRSVSADEWIVIDDYPQLHKFFDFLMGGPDSTYYYLGFMAVRLIEMKRILKPTGSIYLHCDTTMSHYLKILMDCIFGEANYKHEIVWKRKHGGGNPKTFGEAHDLIYFYTKTKDFVFNPQCEKYTDDYIKKNFKYKDERGYYSSVMLVAGASMGGKSPMYEFKGYTPETRWLMTKDKLEALDRDNRVIWPKKKGGAPRRKQYLHEREGKPCQDVWTDINIASGKEYLGYPTQKPTELLERIIKASSNEGDVVLDPFCGSGTTIVAAERLKRKWIGIDANDVKNLINKRLMTEI